MSKKSAVDIIERAKNYDKDHCWQYDIRVNNLQEDIVESGIDPEQIKSIKVTDIYFKPLTECRDRQEATEFIHRHEWLGTLSQFTTHWFGAFYHDPNQWMIGREVMVGVVLMNMPNAFSKLLGDDTQSIERLISRGACISWSPKKSC